MPDLFKAARCGHEEVVERLLSEGADPSYTDAAHGNWTALMFAAGAGHLKIVKRLLSDTRVVASACDVDGRDAVSIATQFNHASVVELLQQHIAENALLSTGTGISTI